MSPRRGRNASRPWLSEAGPAPGRRPCPPRGPRTRCGPAWATSAARSCSSPVATTTSCGASSDLLAGAVSGPVERVWLETAVTWPLSTWTGTSWSGGL